MTNQPGTIIKDYLDQHKLTLRGLAAEFNAVLADRPYPPRKISHAAIHHWVQGMYLPYPPRLEFIAANGPDDLRQLAQDLLDCIAVK